MRRRVGFHHGLPAAWLRDGETIVFSDRDDDGVSQIYAIRSDGSDRRALTAGPFNVQFGEGIDNGAYRLNTVTGELVLAVPDAPLVVTVP